MKLFKKNKKINVLKLSGIIQSGNNKDISLANYKEHIDKAFSGKKIDAVALIINSPGGSPVQSELVASYIVRKSNKTNIPTIAFVEDVAASGGYWIALAADKIYAQSKASIVGSLGVLYASFGLEDFIKKHGINRRVHTAGEKKVTLDMFQPEKEEEIQMLQERLGQLHNHFKDWVLSRRKDKITLKEQDLFSGAYWLAVEGHQHGLVDGIEDMYDKLENLYGKNIKYKYINTKPKKSFIMRLIGGSAQQITSEVIAEIKHEIHNNKYQI